MTNVNRGSIGGTYGDQLVPESVFYAAAFALSCHQPWTG